MKNIKMFLLIPVAGVLSLSACSENENSANTKNVISETVITDTLVFVKETAADFKTPESVKYDKKNDIFYVTNINGNPSEKDGNGFVSKLNKEGEIIDLKWVIGLNAPKGTGIFDDKLYVSDIDELAEISIPSGKIMHKYAAKGAKFLNDIDIDKNGTVYVSDTKTGNIWILKNDTFQIWLQSEKLLNSNGLFVEGDNLLIGTKTKILIADLNTKALKTLIDNSGSTDGLEYAGNGKYLFSDWSGHVYIAKSGGEKKLLLNTADEKINAADIEFVRETHTLLIPTFYHNTVSFYELKE